MGDPTWTTSHAVSTCALAAILGVAIAAPNTVAASEAPPSGTCLESFNSVITIQNDFGSSQYVHEGQTERIGFDAFGSIWSPEPVDGEPAPSSINVTTGGKTCWAGGRVVGLQSGDPLVGNQDAPAAMSVSGLDISPIDFEIEWIEVSDVTHALESSLTFNYLILRDVLIEELQGDCINLSGEVRTLVIHNSIIDACSHLVNDKSENFMKDDSQLLIRDSVIRLKAGVGEQLQNAIPLPVGTRPKVKIVDSVFLLDGPLPLAESLIVGFRVTIDESRNNIIILGDSGEVIGPLPQGFRIVKNKKVWASKRERWLEDREARLQQTGGDDGAPGDNPGGTVQEKWADGTLWNDATGWID
jgi:hypothetical protein